MADLSGLGDLVLTVGGDITPLTSALDSIPAAAQQAASEIQAAFDALPSATEGVNQSLANLSTGLSEAGTSATEAAGHVAEVPPALHDTSEAAGEAGAKLKEFVTAGLELAGIALTFEALKEAVTEIVSAFDQLQRATISLTALTGSSEQATTAIESLKTLAIGEGLSFPSLITAQQRMYAFGISATQIPQLLQAAANAAAVMGTDIESAASKLDRIAVSGTVAARQLTTLGLTTHDLAEAMGVADSAVKSTFASMDQSARVDVLIAALQKFQGVAAAVADTLSGSWQSFKTSVEVALEGVGEAIDTSLTSTVKTAQESVVPGIQAMTKAFQDLASVFGPIITGAVNSFTQGMGDLLNVVSSGITALVTLGKSANDTGISFGQLVHYVADVTPWGLFADSIHQAAVDLNLLHADADMATASVLVMTQRFASVTDSLKAFIDKTSAGHDNLLAIRTDFDALKQAVADAQAKLELVTQAYNQGMASAGQLEAATKALTAAQLALNGAIDTTKFTMSSIATAYDALKTALATANANLDLVSKAYLSGTASLAQYQAAVTALKTAQDALNGSLEKSPIQQVEDEFNQLNTNLAQAQDKLNAVVEAMKTGQASMGQYESAVAAVNSAQQALTGSANAATTAISSSAPKVIDVANALNNNLAPAYSSVAAAASSAAAAQAGFVGPVQQSNDAVVVLRGSVSALKDAFDATKVTVIGAGDAFSQTAADLANYVNSVDEAAAATSTLSEDMQTAAVSAGTLAEAVSRGIISGASQGGSGTIHGQPGDVVSGGPTSGGAMGAAGTNITLGTPLQRAEKTLADLQGPQQLQQIYDQIAALESGGTTAATSLTAAATNLTAAAQTQQDAAQTAYDAAKAALVGSQQLQIAANATATGADAISASALAAADAANQAASDASIAGTVATAAVQAVTLATNAMVATAQVVAAIATKAGVPGFISSTLGAAFGSQLALPNVGTASGPGGASTGGLAFANPYSYSGGNAGNVSINVNGSQFLQNLMNEFVQNLQTQGIRLTRG